MVSAGPQQEPVTDNPDGNQQQWNPVLSSDVPSSDSDNGSGAAPPNPPSDPSNNQGGATPSPDNCDQSQTESNNS